MPQQNEARGHGKKWNYCLVLNVDSLGKFMWIYNNLYKTTNILTEKTISFQTLYSTGEEAECQRGGELTS